MMLTMYSMCGFIIITFCYCCVSCVFITEPIISLAYVLITCALFNLLYAIILNIFITTQLRFLTVRNVSFLLFLVTIIESLFRVSLCCMSLCVIDASCYTITVTCWVTLLSHLYQHIFLIFIKFILRTVYTFSFNLSFVN